MTENEILEIFARYGVDVILLSIAVAALCTVLKRTALKDKPRAVTLVAYAAGIIFYAVYACVRELDIAYLTQNTAAVLERGLSTGTLALLICAGIDRFLGGETQSAAEDKPSGEGGETAEQPETGQEL